MKEVEIFTDGACRGNLGPGGWGALKSVDLLQRLDDEGRPHRVEWYWAKGDSGQRENEIAEQLANRAIDELEKA